MSLHKLLLIILVATSVVSCESYLEEKPYSFLSESNFPETAVDGRIALNGAYQPFSGGYILGYNHILAVNADSEYASFGAALTNSYGLYQNFIRTTADAFPGNLWIDLFEGINACNVVIDVSTEKGFDGADKLIAEAKTLRAYYYMVGVNFFGDLPLLQTSINGIASLTASRVDADEIREFILEELDEAEEIMELYPEVFAVHSRGGLLTLGALKMIKAKQHLYMAGQRRSSAGEIVMGSASHWTKVRDICLSIIDMEIYQLDEDYTNVFSSYYRDEYNLESIWEIDFSMPANGTTFPNAMTAPPYGSTSAGGFSNLRTTSEFYFLFDSLDVRRDWTCGSGRFSGFVFEEADGVPYNRPYINKFRKVSGNGENGWNTPYNIPVYRYSDVLLMLAEAENEINGTPTAAAYNAINEVRYRARATDHKSDGLAVPDLSGLDYDSFKNAIMKERTLELAFEGYRRMDLIRWGIYLEKLQAFDDATYGMDKALNVQAYHMLLPVPLEEMNLNPEWTQNEGW